MAQPPCLVAIYLGTIWDISGIWGSQIGSGHFITRLDTTSRNGHILAEKRSSSLFPFRLEGLKRIKNKVHQGRVCQMILQAGDGLRPGQSGTHELPSSKLSGLQPDICV